MSFNPFSLAGKKILVTGASSGIGKETAIVCSKMGATVVITGRNTARLNETFTQLEGDGHVQVIADLLNEKGRSDLINSIDKLDGVVHSAGIIIAKLFKFLKETEIREIMEVNFIAPCFLTQSLLKSRKLNNYGSVVFMHSISGIRSSYIGGTAYSASKGASNGMMMGLALEFANRNIRFNAVTPGMIETPMVESNGVVSEDQVALDKERYPLKRYGLPHEVAYAVVYLLSDASTFTTGTNIILDGGRTLVS